MPVIVSSVPSKRLSNVVIKNYHDSFLVSLACYTVLIVTSLILSIVNKEWFYFYAVALSLPFNFFYFWFRKIVERRLIISFEVKKRYFLIIFCYLLKYLILLIPLIIGCVIFLTLNQQIFSLLFLLLGIFATVLSNLIGGLLIYLRTHKKRYNKK